MKKHSVLIGLVFLATHVTAQEASSTCCTTAGIDHIMLGVSNLDYGMRKFEEVTGVRPIRGGTHPTRGTENALVSLGGGTYLEIIAPRADAKPNELVTALRALHDPALIGWAVHVSDASAAAQRLTRAGFATTPEQPGSRLTPEGTTLRWVTFEVEKPHIDGAPFFIRWESTTTHPSMTSPRGCSVASFLVADPDSDDLARLLGTLGVEGKIVVRALQPRMRIDLRCHKKAVTFASPGTE